MQSSRLSPKATSGGVNEMQLLEHTSIAPYVIVHCAVAASICCFFFFLGFTVHASAPLLSLPAPVLQNNLDELFILMHFLDASKVWSMEFRVWTGSPARSFAGCPLSAR